MRSSRSLSAVAALSALLLAASRALQCTPGTDVVQANLRTLETADDSACAAECQRTSGCAAFTLWSGHCFLKGPGGAVIAKEGACSRLLHSRSLSAVAALSALLLAASRALQCTPGTDVVQANLRTLETADDSACAAECQRTSGCAAFTLWSGHCFLKGPGGAVIAEEGACSRLLQCTPNTDIVKDDMRVVDTSDDSACAAECQRTSGCASFTMWGGRCVLKGPGGAVIAHGGACSRVLQCTPNTDIVVGNLRVVNTSDDSACAAECQRTNGCASFTMRSGRCVLKGPGGAVVSHDGACSRVLQCTPNTDIVKDDLKVINTSDDSACAAECQRTSGCAAITMWSGRCILKGPGGSVIAHDGACSRLLQCTPNTDIVMDNLRVVDTSDDSACAAECQRTSGCASFTMWSGRCVLKGPGGAVIAKEGACSRLLQCTPNTDIVQDDLRVIDTADDSVCARECQRISGCASFTMWGGRCVLKGPSGGAVIAKAGACSRVLQCAPATVIVAEDLAVVDTGDDAVCAAECQRASGCAAFSVLDGRRCVLKGECAVALEQRGACSRLLQCAPNTALVADDLLLVNTSDDSACARECQRTSGCAAFTVWGGRCALKRTAGSAVAKDGACSRALHCVPNTDVVVGEDLRVVDTADDGVCARECRITEGCAAFTVWDGLCFLKRTGGRVVAKPGACSTVF
eukprot:m51a1_g12649 hypothetical protein (690) ;mRNA; f:1698-3943